MKRGGFQFRLIVNANAPYMKKDIKGREAKMFTVSEMVDFYLLPYYYYLRGCSQSKQTEEKKEEGMMSCRRQISTLQFLYSFEFKFLYFIFIIPYSNSFTIPTTQITPTQRKLKCLQTTQSLSHLFTFHFLRSTQN